MYGRAQTADSYETKRLFQSHIITHIIDFVDTDRIFYTNLTRGHVDVFCIFCIAEDDAVPYFGFNE